MDRNRHVVFHEQQPGQAVLARKGAKFFPGKGGHLIVELNGRRSVLPQHGGSKELGKGLWLAIVKQLDIKE
jgi:mRNA interferase HicA